MRPSGILLAAKAPVPPPSKRDLLYESLILDTPNYVSMLDGDVGNPGIISMDSEVIPGIPSPTFVRANNTYIYIDPSDLVVGADNMTCLMFCTITTPSAECYMFSVRRPTTPPNGLHMIGLDSGSNDCKFFWYHDGTVTSSGVNLRDGNMHMVAMVKDATHIRGYVDGFANGTPVARSSSTLYGGVAGAIGNFGPAIGGLGIDGSISAFAYYKDKALSAARIQEIWDIANAA